MKIKQARKELKLIKTDEYITEWVIELLKTLNNQNGHSGTSFKKTLQLFWRLSQNLPLSPLTGEDNEWEEEYDKFVNKRCYYVIKDKKDGQEYWINHKYQRIPIKFPFLPMDEKMILELTIEETLSKG